MKIRISPRSISSFFASVGALLAVCRATAQTSFTTLHNFTTLQPPAYTNDDGANPQAGLLVVGNSLFGTAGTGGVLGEGAVFAVNTDGTGFTALHFFQALAIGSPSTNSNGGGPIAGLVIAGDTLYGTTEIGGRAGVGTIFAINIDGTGFTNLYTFTNGL